jgi:predicted DCC family thiol-disulfide oxidoreductase YuxK
VHTEITETIRGWVFYDANCPFCTRWAWRTDELLARRGWHLAPLQAGWARLLLGLQDGEPLLEMKLLIADGQIFGGADAIIYVARSIWWAWPLFVLAQLPGITPVLRAIYYRRIAKNRFCFGGRCALPAKPVARHRHLTSSFYDLS